MYPIAKSKEMVPCDELHKLAHNSTASITALHLQKLHTFCLCSRMSLCINSMCWIFRRTMSLFFADHNSPAKHNISITSFF